MRNFKNYRGIVENTPDPAIEQNQAMSARIDSIIDSWVHDLMQMLINSGTGARRGIWDKFKGAMSNIWHGRDSEENPYRWVNKFGDNLGKSESFSVEIFKLEDYKKLKETCDNLEIQMNEDIPGAENLKIFQLIRTAAFKLKQDLKNVMGMPVAPSPQMPQAKAPEPTPVKEPVGTKEPTPAAPAGQSGQSSSSNRGFPYSTPEAPVATPEAKPEESKPGAGQSAGEDSQRKPVVGDFYSTPPTTGLAWENLNASQIEKWNQYGGGIYKTLGGDCFKFTKGTPITKLPYILRQGDPRIEVLRSQNLEGPESFNNKYLDKEKIAKNKKLINTPDFNPDLHCSKRHAVVWKKLLAAGRIEGEGNFGEPIKDENDLKQRIEKIKETLIKEPKDTASKDFNEPEITRRPPTIAPATMTTADQRAADAPVAKRRGRPPKPKNVAPEIKDLPNENPVSSEIPHINPTPDSSEEFNLEKEQNKVFNLLNGGSKELFQKYFDRVADAKNSEELDKLKQTILHAIKASNDSDEELEELPEWNLVDKINFFRKKLIN